MFYSTIISFEGKYHCYKICLMFQIFSTEQIILQKTQFQYDIFNQFFKNTYP